MRAIDADELKKCVLKWLPQDPCGKEEKEMPFETDICVSMLMEIDEQPTIQPKRGKWIEDKGQQMLMQNFIERGEVWRVCSVCGAGHMIGYKYAIDKAYHDRHHNFCPNCGAKMEVTEWTKL